MTGKVFDDSLNIYQDQAKVLFDYYKKLQKNYCRRKIR